ncbi:MAG: metallophosphoesterase [bacterium]|nr:metallophosphoesterase [bacterium]MCP5066269.1 metallophosphoesterase [bacterium]
MPLLAHLSDLHVTTPRWRSLGEITPKRVLGALSWGLRRRHEHRPEVLEALLRDLETTSPDRVLVTGDVTNQGLQGEIEAGRDWLLRLGGPDRVLLVPGNHDIFVPGGARAVEACWGPFLAHGTASTAEPRVRVADGVALVGVDSARATSAGQATGRIGQRARHQLECCLRALGRRRLRRVVLLHHPPWIEGISRRRALEDAGPLRELLGRVGAELVLHGHVHRLAFTRLSGPEGDIPVVGVPSASARGARGRDHRARYHLLRPLSEGGWSCRARVFDPGTGLFEEASSRELGR